MSGLLAQEPVDVLAGAEREGSDVDHVGDAGMIARLADHGAGVRVADEHHVAADRIERRPHGGRVTARGPSGRTAESPRPGRSIE